MFKIFFTSDFLNQFDLICHIMIDAAVEPAFVIHTDLCDILAVKLL